MENKLEVALIGVGKWGKKLLAELTALTKVKIVVNRDSEETRSFLRENYPSIKSTNDINEVISDPQIKAVFVATPTSTHYEIAKKIITSKKHLFLEKPGGKNSEELAELVNLAKNQKVIMSIGYEFAHHKALKKIKEIIEGQKIISIDMEWFKWGNFDDLIPAHLLSHEISILKNIITKQLITGKLIQKSFISNSDILYCEFLTDETTINCTINRISPEKRKTVTIKSEKDILIWNNNDLFKVSKDKKLEKIEIKDDSAVKCEIENFIESVKTNLEPKTSGYFGLEVYKIIESF